MKLDLIPESELAEMEARDKAATPGPWEIEGRWFLDSKRRIIGELYAGYDQRFIHASRTDLPRLTKAYREAVKKGERLENMVLEKGTELKIAWALQEQAEQDAEEWRTIAQAAVAPAVEPNR